MKYFKTIMTVLVISGLFSFSAFADNMNGSLQDMRGSKGGRGGGMMGGGHNGGGHYGGGMHR